MDDRFSSRRARELGDEPVRAKQRGAPRLDPARRLGVEVLEFRRVVPAKCKGAADVAARTSATDRLMDSLALVRVTLIGTEVGSPRATATTSLAPARRSITLSEFAP